MSRTVAAEESELIVRVITEHPDGIGISALEKALAHCLVKVMNRRTLQRRLGHLLADKRIVTEGESVALVYKRALCPMTCRSSVPAQMSVHEAETYIPVSEEGKIIRNLVRQPLMRRKPAGYQRSFLQEYEPGVTFYLSEPLRADLHEMGRTPASERPAGTYAREILNRLLIDMSWASSRLEGNT